MLLRLRRDFTILPSQASILVGLAYTMRDAGEFEAALAYADKAIRAVESQRELFQDPDLKSRFASTVKYVYDIYVETSAALYLRESKSQYAEWAIDRHELAV